MTNPDQAVLGLEAFLSSFVVVDDDELEFVPVREEHGLGLGRDDQS